MFIRHTENAFFTLPDGRPNKEMRENGREVFSIKINELDAANIDAWLSMVMLYSEQPLCWVYRSIDGSTGIGRERGRDSRVAVLALGDILKVEAAIMRTLSELNIRINEFMQTKGITYYDENNVIEQFSKITPKNFVHHVQCLPPSLERLKAKVAQIEQKHEGLGLFKYKSKLYSKKAGLNIDDKQSIMLENTLHLFPAFPKLNEVIPAYSSIDSIEVKPNTSIVISKSIQFPRNEIFEKTYVIEKLFHIVVVLEVLSGELSAKDGMTVLCHDEKLPDDNWYARLFPAGMLLSSLISESMPGNKKIRYIDSDMQENLNELIGLKNENQKQVYSP